MSMQVTIGLNPETLSAISELTAAIRSLGGVATSSAPVTKTPAATKNADAGKDEGAGADQPIYWFTSSDKSFGVVDTQKAFDALKKKDSKVVKITAEKHNKMAADKAAADAAAAGGDDEEFPTEQDVLDAFGGYLPPDLDKEERGVRAAFVKPLLARFGAKKASELPEQHRKLAINLVLRKAAGQDIDPESDDYEDFEAEEDNLV